MPETFQACCLYLQLLKGRESRAFAFAKVCHLIRPSGEKLPLKGDGGSLISGGYSGGVPPLPIPNREVKPARADGTAHPWESR